MSDQAELQAKVQKLQAMSQQLQQAAQQRSQMEAMGREAKAAVEALEAVADGASVYRNVGSLLIQDDRAAAITRLQDEQETMAIRVKRASEQEKQLRASLDALQSELQAAFGQ